MARAAPFGRRIPLMKLPVPTSLMTGIICLLPLLCSCVTVQGHAPPMDESMWFGRTWEVFSGGGPVGAWDVTFFAPGTRQPREGKVYPISQTVSAVISPVSDEEKERRYGQCDQRGCHGDRINYKDGGFERVPRPKDGETHTRDDEGEIIATRVFADGKPASFRTYYKGGKVKSRTSYNERGQRVSKVYFNEAGQLVNLVVWDVSRKQLHNYSADGRLKSISTDASVIAHELLSRLEREHEELSRR